MPHPSNFQIGNVTAGGDDLFLIAGPCVLESERHARSLADAVQRIASDLRLPYIFKASFDKANRTSIRSFRGPGLTEGCRILRAIAESNHLPVLTDVHTPEQCAQVSDAVAPADLMLQIPAFLCRQTDLLAAAARTGRAVNIKKGQFVAPWDMRHAVQKVKETHEALAQELPTLQPRETHARICLTERGASFGYNNLVVDFRSLPILRGYAPVVFDATHSVQMPSSSAPTPSPAACGTDSTGRDPASPGTDATAPAVSGGQPEFIPVLARAAVAAGIDGLFLEVHDNPAQAKSDGANALRLNLLQPLLETLLTIRKAVGK